MGATQITAEPGTQTIDVVREFNAPPELLLRAYTEVDLFAQWITGPYDLEIDTFESKHGGNWRYTASDETGNEFAFRGVFHGTPSLEHGITQTFEFESWPGQVSLETVTFEDLGGRTRLHVHSVYQTVEDRDTMIESDMEAGMNSAFAKLDELLQTLT